MTTQAESNIIGDIGERIHKAREQSELTQDELAAPRFTAEYISALEGGSLRPSLKALEHLASNLGLPVSHFMSSPDTRSTLVSALGIASEADLSALREDLAYQYTYARMLIRTARVEKALDLIKTAEESAAPYAGHLPTRLLFRPAFLRGMAHLQCNDPVAAMPELEKALRAAGEDRLPQTVVRNLLGVAYYLLTCPTEALRQHLYCLESVESGIAKDLNLRQSILRNLANDYWALNDVTQAIATYKRALLIVEDLDGCSRQAYLFWALAMAYRAANDRGLAKLYARRAMQMYEELNQSSNLALVCIQLAELLLPEGRYTDVAELLAKVEATLSDSTNRVLLCKLHYNRADLLRRLGDLERAAEEAESALAFISQETARRGTGNRELVAYSPLHIVRTHAMALHVAALVQEERGHHDLADAFFEQAIGLTGEIELVELIHTIAFSYADVLKARNNFKRAGEQYRLAALSAPGMVRLHI
jgi:tetratricopeptide (TPR) repeat protein